MAVRVTVQIINPWKIISTSANARFLGNAILPRKLQQPYRVSWGFQICPPPPFNFKLKIHSYCFGNCLVNPDPTYNFAQVVPGNTCIIIQVCTWRATIPPGFSQSRARRIRVPWRFRHETGPRIPPYTGTAPL